MLINKNLYYVGGVVRDSILGKASIDTDFCFEGNAIEFAEQNNLNITKINPDFCTVRVNYESKDIDIASTRTEIYPKKGHLPKITNIGCSLSEDLKRRDFTINAMAKRTTDNEIIDYYGGMKDINSRVLRILHENSFVDDPTRIIRGLKFSVRFGFELESDTRLLQNKYLENINYDMSYHRIKKELTETFNLNNPIAYDRFIQEGIYKLLGENIISPNIKGTDIKNAIGNINTQNIWLIYIAPFILNQKNPNTNIPLTRIEKRILEWAVKLKDQEKTNNTPIESIILKELLY